MSWMRRTIVIVVLVVACFAVVDAGGIGLAASAGTEPASRATSARIVSAIAGDGAIAAGIAATVRTLAIIRKGSNRRNPRAATSRHTRRTDVQVPGDGASAGSSAGTSARLMRRAGIAR